MLKLGQSLYDSIRRHGEETYPHECCGVLLGQMEDDGTRVVFNETLEQDSLMHSLVVTLP